jgi:hypothetical protein
VYIYANPVYRANCQNIEANLNHPSIKATVPKITFLKSTQPSVVGQAISIVSEKLEPRDPS